MLIKIFCHINNNWKLHKIGSLLTKSDLAIHFFWNFSAKTTMSKLSEVWDWRFHYWLQPRSQIKTLCPVWKRARAPDSSVTNEIKNFVTYLFMTSFFVKSSFYDVTQGDFTSFFESDWFCNIKSQLIAANYWVRCLCWCTQKSSHQISAPQQVLNFWQNTVNLGKIITLLFCLEIFNNFTFLISH